MKQQRAAVKRNTAPVIEVNKKDERFISQYLYPPKDVDGILPEPIVGLGDVFEPGDEFL